METEMIPFDAMNQMATAVAKSGLWKSAAKPEQALALMLLCQSEGLHPMTAVRRYDLIQGTPTLKSEAQLAEFYKRGGCVKWIKRDETECRAKFSHPKHCPDGVEIHWTIEMAKKANLTGKDNWKNYPRQMLSARVQAEGVQVVDPGAGLGMLLSEEAIDVQNGWANLASEQSAQLTGEERQEIQSLPEVTLTPAEAKKARADLNRELQACGTVPLFRMACKAFQDQYTKGIWVKETGHDKSYEIEGGFQKETFALLAMHHESRVKRDEELASPEGVQRWIDFVEKSDLAGLTLRVREYHSQERLQNEECLGAIHERALQLGLTGIQDLMEQESEEA